jgi:hypothetical protein
MSMSEIDRRLDRDAEHLLSKLLPVVRIIDLPPFNYGEYWQSLDTAAQVLVDEGVAVLVPS